MENQEDQIKKQIQIQRESTLDAFKRKAREVSLESSLRITREKSDYQSGLAGQRVITADEVIKKAEAFYKFLTEGY